MPWQQRTALPAIDAARHMMDAFSKAEHRIQSLPGAHVFVQEYQPVLDGPLPPRIKFFDEQPDQLIDQRHYKGRYIATPGYWEESSAGCRLIGRNVITILRHER